MKVQDLLFLFVFFVLIIKTNYKWLVAAGIIFLTLSIPLFYLWVFFTAQKLLEYAFYFFVASIIVMVVKEAKRAILD